MRLNTTTSPLLLASYLGKRTDDFTGREWIFREIDLWLGSPDGPRYFLLTGEPGSGKTALAARLAQFSQNSIPPPGNTNCLLPNFLSAIHFCSVRETRWLSPHTFSESMAMQLAAHYPAYAQALAEISSRQNILFDVDLNVQQVEKGQISGVIIQSLNVNGTLPPPEDVFNFLVRRPLDALFKNGIDQQVIILIDALDESLHYSGEVSILSLLTKADTLPTGVRFIITSRYVDEVLRPLRRSRSLVEHTLSSGIGLTNSHRDVKQYIVNTVSHPAQVALTQKLPPSLSINDFADVVQRKSNANFLYVQYLLKMLTDQQEMITLESLERLPTGLDGIYIEFLERLIGDDQDTWDKEYKPVIGALAVAQEALSEKQLSGFVGTTESKVRRVLTDLRQFLQADDALPASQRTYSLYHRSFSDFLLDPDRAEVYWCEEAEQHQRIINYYRKGAPSWEAIDWHQVDNYSLLYLATHLYALRGQETARQELYALICKPFMQEKQVRTGSHRSFAENVALAIEVASGEIAPNLLQVIRCSVIYATLGSMATNIPPEALTVLVQRGLVSRSLSVAGLMQDPEKQSQAYLLIGEALFAQQQVEEAYSVLRQALKTIEEIGDKQKQVEILSRAVKAFITIGDQERASTVANQALEIADSLFRRKDKVKTLAELAQKLAQLGLVDQAVNAALAIGNQQDKAQSLKIITGTLAQIGKFDLALTAAETIKEPWSRATALVEVARVLARKGQMSRAQEIAQRAAVVTDEIPTWVPYVNALSAVAQLFMQLEMSDLGERTLNQALQGIESLDNTRNQVEALVLIIQIRVSMDQLDIAEQLLNDALTRAQTIEDEYDKSVALPVVVEALLSMEHLDRALAVAKGIEDSWDKASALGDVAVALIGAGEFDEAMAVAKLMSGSSESEEWRNLYVDDYDIRRVAEAFARARHFEQAMAVAQLLVGDESGPSWQKSHTLREICSTLCSAGDFDQAVTIARTIEDKFIQDDTFREIAQSLAQAGRIDQAIVVAQEGDAIAALSAVANTLAQKGLLAEAEDVANRALTIAETIGGERQKTEALGSFARVLASLEQLEQAESAANEVLVLAETIEDEDSRIDLLLNTIYLLLGLKEDDCAAIVQRAMGIVQTLEDPWNKVAALKELTHMLAELEKLEHAEVLADETLRLAEALNDKRAIALTLVEVAYVLAAKGEVVQGEEKASQAVSMVKSIKQISRQKKIRSRRFADMSDRVQSLCNIAQELSIIGEATRAGNVARRAAEAAQKIGDVQRKAFALRLAAQILAQTGQFDQAITLTEMCEDVAVRANIDSIIAYVLAQSRQFERAITVTLNIDHPSVKIFTLGRIAYLLASGGRQEEARALMEQAREVTQTIDDGASREEAWFEVVRTLAQIGQTSQALDMIKNIDNAHTQTSALIEIAQALTKEGKREEALVLIEQAFPAVQTMEEQQDKESALKEIVYIQIQADQLEQAERSISMITDNLIKAQAIRGSAYLLAKMGRFDQAVVRVQTIRTDWVDETLEKVMALGDIATVLIQREALEQARTIADQALKTTDLLFDEQAQADALSRMAQVLVTADILDRVLAEAQNRASEYKAQVLSNIGQALAQKGRRKQAEDIINQALEAANTIEDAEVHVRCLIQIARALFQNGSAHRARDVADQAITAAETIGELGVYTQNQLTTVLAIIKATMIMVRLEEEVSMEDLTDLVRQLVESAEEVWAKTLILIEGARGFAQIGNREQVEAITEEVSTLVESLDVQREKVEALSQVALILDQVGRQDLAKERVKKALTIATAIEDEQDRIAALSQIAPILIQTEQFDEALASIQRIKEGDPSPDIRGKAIQLLADIGQFDQALAEVEAIDYQPAKASIFRHIAHVMLEKGRLDEAKTIAERALKIAETFGDEEAEALALSEVAILLQRAGERDRAKTFAEQALIVAQAIGDELEKDDSSSTSRQDVQLRIMEYRKTKVFVLSKIAHILMGLEENEQAREAINLAMLVLKTISTEQIQVDAWNGILPSLLEEQDDARKTSVREQVLAIVDTLPSRQGNILEQEDEDKDSFAVFTTYTLVDLFYAFERASYYNQAAAVLNAIDANWKESDSLRKMVYAVIHLSQHININDDFFSFVQDTIERIGDAWYRADALIEFAGMLYRIGKKEDAVVVLNQALPLAQTLSNNPVVTTVAKRLVIKESSTTIQTQSFTAGDKMSALSKIAHSFAQMGETEQAETIMDQMSRAAADMEDVEERANVQQQVASILASCSQYERSITLARTIKDAREKSLALMRIAQALQQAEQSEQALLIMLEACNTARLMGRGNVFNILEQGATILGAIDHGRTLWQLYETLQKIDSWWGTQ